MMNKKSTLRRFSTLFFPNKNKIIPRDSFIISDIYSNKASSSIENIADIYDSLEDGRVTKFYFMKMRLIELAIGIFNIFSLFFSVLHSDHSYYNPNERLYNTSLLTLVFIFTLFTVFLTFVRYSVKLKLQKARREISKMDDLITTNNYFYIIAEILLYSIMPYPFLQGLCFEMRIFADDSFVTYEINHIFAIFMMFRIVIIIRFFLHFSIYLTPRAYRLCKVYGCNFGYLYAIRCLFKSMPIKLLTTFLTISVLLFSYVLRISERPIIYINPDLKNLQMNFAEFSNSLWCVVVSISTIGYGDFYPVTLIGRGVITLTGFWGIFVISVLVVSVSDILEMDVAENKALNLLIRLEQRKYLKKEAAFLLTSVYKYKKIKKNGMLSKKMHQQFTKKLRSHINSFKRISRKIQSTYDLSNIYEIMGSYFDSLKEELKNIRASQEFLLLQMGVEPESTKENVIEEKENIQLSPKRIEISAKPQYLSVNFSKEAYNYNEEVLDSNKRFLETEK